ncbi:MAG: M23 family metallopeptidase [Nitrosomonadales bacterium]|nr:M23 family metallopeptidase [Nitrosomonadales bacterium]
MKTRIISSTIFAVSLSVSPAIYADCWRLPNGQTLTTNAGSTPPVNGAQRIQCPSQQQLTIQPSTRYPIAGAITQPFGVPWSVKPWKTHTGIDIAASAGTPVPSVSAGTVAAIRNLGGEWGYAVVIREASGLARGYASRRRLRLRIVAIAKSCQFLQSLQTLKTGFQQGFQTNT